MIRLQRRWSGSHLALKHGSALVRLLLGVLILLIGNFAYDTFRPT
jgi:hypothetical protein